MIGKMIKTQIENNSKSQAPSHSIEDLFNNGKNVA